MVDMPRDYMTVELQKGYAVLPISRMTPTSPNHAKYAVYYYATLIGLIIADKDISVDRCKYILTKWDHGVIATSYNLQELLDNICAQHRMGIIQ